MKENRREKGEKIKQIPKYSEDDKQKHNAIQDKHTENRKRKAASEEEWKLNKKGEGQKEEENKENNQNKPQIPQSFFCWLL